MKKIMFILLYFIAVAVLFVLQPYLGISSQAIASGALPMGIFWLFSILSPVSQSTPASEPINFKEILA